jgi:hypothetical protein
VRARHGDVDVVVEQRIGCERIQQVVGGGAQGGRVGVAERLGHRQGQPRMRVGHQLEDGRNGGGGIGGGGRCENSDHVSSIYEARTVRKR